MAFLASNLTTSTLVLIAGMALFIVLCFTKIPRIFSALFAVAVISLASVNGYLQSLMVDWIQGTGSVITAYLLVMLTGAAVGAVMMATGCSDRLARSILNKVGRDKGPLVIMIICFVVLVSGNTGHTWVLLPVLLSVCRECDMPRGIGMMAYVAMVQITQFDLVGIPGFPNVLVAQALGVSLYETPLMSIIEYVIGLVLVYVISMVFWKRARKKGHGFEVVPEVDFYKIPEERPEDSLPSIWYAWMPIVIMVGGSFVLNMGLGWDSTFSAVVPQWITVILLSLTSRKTWVGVGDKSKLQQIMESMESVIPMMITTGAIGGMATVISNTMAYDSAMNGLLSLNISPYLCAFLVVGGICVITCDGIAGMQVFLSAMADRFISIPGINLGALHRVIVSTACTVDSLPYSSSAYMYCSVFGYTLKSGWKYQFLGTVFIPLCTALFAVVYSSIAWPC